MEPVLRAGRACLALVVLAAGRAKRYGGCEPPAPVGLHGEAVIDLVASDVLAAGFDTIVMVLGPSSGPAIRYHVEHTWPAAVDVRFATQPSPRGTVDAVLSASDHVGDAVPTPSATPTTSTGARGAPCWPSTCGPTVISTPGGLPSGRRRGRLLAGDPWGICRVGADGDLLASTSGAR